MSIHNLYTGNPVRKEPNLSLSITKVVMVLKQGLQITPFLLYYRPQRSWGKVIFSQASVILLTGRGGTSSWGVFPPGGCSLLGSASSQGVPPPGGLVETPRDSYCCRRYASYWNAFLFNTESRKLYPGALLNAD